MASSIYPPLPQIDSSRLSFIKTVAPQLAPAIDSLKGNNPTADIKPEDVVQLKLANSVAELSHDHPEITRGLVADPAVSTLRDVAFKYNNHKLATLAKSDVQLASLAEIPHEVLSFQRKVFHLEPSAVLARMVKEGDIAIGTDVSPPPANPQKQVEPAADTNAPVTVASTVVPDINSRGPAGPQPLLKNGTPVTPPSASSLPTPQAPSNQIKDGVLKFFEDNPSFNIRNTSVLVAVSEPKALDGVTDDVKPDVVTSLKLLQRTQALTHDPVAIPGLAKNGLTSAHAISQMSEDRFIANFNGHVGGEEIARSIHVHATNVAIRNDMALTSLLQTVRGTGIAMIDGQRSRMDRMQKAKEIFRKQPEQINLESLFGPLEMCACDDCNSVTSPAAYFVELLQYLRNNNLDPNKQPLGTTQNGYAGTPLETLLRRRPDLADLELTCTNTNTVLPYIDLANEVMESFIVHMTDYAQSGSTQAKLDVYNADSNTEGLGGSSAELLAQPQNTNDQAYSILKEAVYPSTKLPFHQPVEAIRLFLEFLNTSRAELQLLFRKPYHPPKTTIPDPLPSSTCTVPRVGSSYSNSNSESCSSSSTGSSCSDSEDSDCSEEDSGGNQSASASPTPITEENQEKLRTLHDLALSRADDAERLLLTEEEYIILTKEAFWLKEYFDIRHGTVPPTPTELYRDRIGVKKDYEYWGVDYTSVDEMLSQNENTPNFKGLTLVKTEFLPRTGLTYSDLVDLLKTEFINPNVPKGRDSVILRTFRLTYRFLQQLMKQAPPPSGSHHHHYDRFKPIVDFMLDPHWRALLDKLKAPDVVDLFEQEDEDDHLYEGCGCCLPVPQHRRRHHQRCHCRCHIRRKIFKWLCKNFDKIGKIIVLESVRQRELARFEAALIRESDGAAVGQLRRDGSIYKDTQPQSEQIGLLNIDGTVSAQKDDAAHPLVPWHDKFGTTAVTIDRQKQGEIDEMSFLKLDPVRSIVEGGEGVLREGDFVDTCDIRQDRLRHLDGSSVCVEDCDRMHRFIRLWRKLGWSMIELDIALRVLRKKSATPSPPPAEECPCHMGSDPKTTCETGEGDDVDWTDFVDSQQQSVRGPLRTGTAAWDSKDANKPCECGHYHHHPHHRRRRKCTCGCKFCSKCKHKPQTSSNAPDITPEFLHELVALKKLADLTGLPVLKLLTFWGTISTSGSPSLYSQLFLTHNLLGIDQVFKADENDNYLAASPPEKISSHIHILLAAFQLKLPDFVALVKSISSDLGLDLTLESVSLLYRHVLLGSILGLKPDQLKSVFETFDIKPFESAAAAVELIELWNTISEAGFTFPQLRYIFTGFDDPLQHIGPSERSILQTAMTLYTGLNDIDNQNKDIDSEEAATSAVVLAKLQLLFSPDVATQIAGFLDGTYTFTTKAPSGLTITIPKEEKVLNAKLKYSDGEKTMVQSTGQLTPEELAKAKDLSPSPQWAQAIDRIARRAANFVKTTLGVIFTPEMEAVWKPKLIVGDVIPAASDTNAASAATGPMKRKFFLDNFMPFLRRKLADKLVTDTMAGATSLDPLITLELLTNVIEIQTGTTFISALEAFEQIKEDPQPTDGFSGYLIPDTTDEYILVVGDSDTQPPVDSVMLDSLAVPLPDHDPDDEPPDQWASKPLRLTGGRLYHIELKGIKPGSLQWRTDRSQLSVIPSSSLLGQHVTSSLKDLFVIVYKCAIVINGFSLTADEVMYIQTHGIDFSSPESKTSDIPVPFNWRVETLAQWKRLADYTKLKQSLPKLGKPLIDLFKWMNGSEARAADAKTLGLKINEYTLWNEDDIANLINKTHFDIASAVYFCNEINLIKLQKAIQVRNKVGVDIDLLFQWAPPRIGFWKTVHIRESIRIAIRAQYKLSDWEVAIKPTYDKLRQLQSDALTAYLINQPAVKNNGVVAIIDADSLFEFLLIDNQMCPCMETARLKQATSSVQLFVQRCMLGLEPDVSVDVLDRGRWDWMQRYRVWEANRKVYLYPENWIQPSLRDDKSPIYLQLESELHQKDLDSASILEHIKNFLFRLDEIANLEVQAIYVEDPSEDKTKPGRIRVFASTRGAPYKFYYRLYDLEEKTWQPWQDMAVDIPIYQIERPKKAVAPGGGPQTPGPTLGKSTGCYLIPFTYNSRLLVGIPQFMKVQLPAPTPQGNAASIANNNDVAQSDPDEYWEIKMGLSELRNGRWTPKQMASEAVSETPGHKPLPPIGSYKFVARKVGDVVLIDIYRLEDITTVVDPHAELTPIPVGRFSFSGNYLGRDTSNNALDVVNSKMPWSDFHFQGEKPLDPNSGIETSEYRVMYPIQGTESGGWEHELDAYVKYPFDETNGTSRILYYGQQPAPGDPPIVRRDEAFYHPFAHQLLDKVWRTDHLDDFFDYFSAKSMGHDNEDDAFGRGEEGDQPRPLNELYRPYSLYNWEMGFHAPMAIVDRLVQNQQFDLALKMMQYVFNPLAKGPGEQRYWGWAPFRDDSVNALESSVQLLFNSLSPGQSVPMDHQINMWRNHPFQPHVIARLRPTAYMKYVVMKYISILIAYGDYYFRQNTLEMIPMAIQCYILASHIYGPTPQKIPKRGTKEIQTYRSLLDNWDAFSNAMVQMEVLFPFSINQIPAALGKTKNVVGVGNIFGFAAIQYFCIPDNPDLRALRDTIDDRLFKLRHCQDINGIERKLPLYEPAIDPGLLVAAQAAGLSLSSVLNDLNSPLPNFRFKPLLKKALEMCHHLKCLGAALVVAKERKDAEGLMALKQTHAKVVNDHIMEQKKLNRDEADKAVQALQQSREAPVYRMKHSLEQLGEDLGNIPDAGDIESKFKELAQQIEPPVVESGMKLIAAERDDLKQLAEALNLQPMINAIETAASELHVLPTLNAHASPFGVGVASCWGPPNIAKGIQGAAKAFQTVSNFLAQTSAKISKVRNFARATEERIKNANSTGHEIKTIDKQIVSQEVRVAVHDADIAAHEKVIANTEEVQEFLSSKYTSQELYIWIDQETSALYYRTYTAAYDLARKAEAAFRYERGLPDATNPPPYIKFGYWEPQNSGLLCGDRLLLSLKELEAVYQEARGHDFEVTKHVSLRAVNPLELMRLRGDATAEFAVPEILFDMDFPGHYGRRIKSVALSIRMRAGSSLSPFDNANATLRLTSHKFRNSSIVNGKDYPEKTDAEDLRFSSASHVPISAIATSSSTSDSGVFVLDFSDQHERFLPFEGAGAISMWRLELNSVVRGFDYDAVDDVVLSMKYTSLDGGNKLRDAANDAVGEYIKSVAEMSDREGLYAVFDVPRDFSAEWAAAMSSASAADGSAAGSRKLPLTKLNEKLPAYAGHYAPEKILTKDVWVLTDKPLAPSDVSVKQGGAAPLSFMKAEKVVGSGDGALSALHSTDGPVQVRDWVVGLGSGVSGVQEFWVVIRYALKS